MKKICLQPIKKVLSYHIVIYILNFTIFRIDKPKEFDLFGKFRPNFVVQIIRCIFFHQNSHAGFWVDPSNILYLNYIYKWFPMNITSDTIWKNLNYLNIVGDHVADIFFNGFDINKDNFPRLENVCIISDDDGFITRSIPLRIYTKNLIITNLIYINHDYFYKKEAKIIQTLIWESPIEGTNITKWVQLDHLIYLSIEQNDISDLLFRTQEFKNLKSLQVQSINITGDFWLGCKNLEMFNNFCNNYNTNNLQNFPKLKHFLDQSNCDFRNIALPESIEIVQLFRRYITFEVLKRMRFLRKLTFGGCTLPNKFPEFKNLVRLEAVENFYAGDYQIEIKENFPTLKELKLIHVKITSITNNFCSRLKFLDISFVKIRDDIFQVFEFNNLEHLRICSETMKFNDWKEFNQLKKIELKDSEKCLEIFCDFRFKNLRSIKISSHGHFIDKILDERNFQFVKSISISGTPGVDLFMKNYKFPLIEYIEMQLSNDTGKNWIKTNNLKKIRVHHKKRFESTCDEWLKQYLVKLYYLTL